MNLPPLDLGAIVAQAPLRPGVLLAVALAAAGYALGARRVGRAWPAWRSACFAAGLAVVLLATCTGIEPYGRVLEWVHMVEHLLLIMVAPALLALGSPLQLLAEALSPPAAAGWRAFLARPVVSWLTSPAAAAVLYAIVVIGVHLTGLMDTAMTDPATHVTEELVYLGAGFLLFQLVLGVTPGPWQLSGAGRLGLLAVVTPVDTVVGFVLLQTGTVAGGAGSGSHGAMPRPDWALSPASDTVAAGTTMWIGGTGLMAAIMVGVALIWLHGRAPAQVRPSWTDQARRAALAEHTGTEQSAGDLDSDEGALDAYNAWLARLADGEGKRR